MTNPEYKLWQKVKALAEKTVDDDCCKKFLVDNILDKWTEGVFTLQEAYWELQSIQDSWIGEASNYNCSEDW